ncbi:MAG TPA: penicillin-binding protein 1C, partial [Nostocaceae cyanobacterium]|nr:penicillin-binding protein 1C [Nostocaceae cyanobacterium]
NFTGEPMRQVSGVTGAAPLWNRIMLHLHEHKTPANFPSPPNLVKLLICANSGLKPTPDCPSIVQEYFYPEDKIAYEQPKNFALSSEYDEWLARQQPSQLISHQLKILSPHNGDLFLLYPGADAEQKLEFKVAGTLNHPLELWLNGTKLASQSTNAIFWHLQPGNWTLEARSGGMIDKINFQVKLAQLQPQRRGFSVAKPTK